jgi:hypothetical protein
VEKRKVYSVVFSRELAILFHIKRFLSILESTVAVASSRDMIY